MTKLITYISIALLFSACETLVTGVDIPEAEVKMVAFGGYSTISDKSSVQLTQSSPLLNNNNLGEFEPIKDATVMLHGKDSTYIFWKYTEDTYLSTQLDINAGDNFELQIQAPGFSEVTFNVTMPDSVEILSYELDSTETDFWISYEVIFSVKDDPTTDNFYRIEALDLGTSGIKDVFVTNSLITDQTAANGVLNFRSEIESFEKISRNTYITISAISEEEYTYLKALQNYQPGNPFAEPTPLPNNAEGGLGNYFFKNSKIFKMF